MMVAAALGMAGTDSMEIRRKVTIIVARAKK
jgi:hypothetical protein